MSIPHTQNVLRHDRKHAAQREGPKRRRPKQNPDADTADVRARQVQPFAKKDPAQNQVSNERRNDSERGSFIAFENAVEQMAHQQNAGDEERRNVTVVEFDPHAGSLTLKVWLTDGLSKTWVFPEGQRISTFSSLGLAPKPKCNRRWFCEQKPLPPVTCCTCCRPSQNTRTSAPIALRLLAVPSSSKLIDLFSGATVFL